MLHCNDLSLALAVLQGTDCPECMDGKVQDGKLKQLCYVDVSKASQWFMH